MASTGLSRRRVPPSSSSTTATSADDDHDGSKSSPIGNGNGSHSNSGTGLNNLASGGGHAGSAFEGGSKIAYDPRDLDLEASEEARAGGKMPRLTIMEEVLLLGIKDKQGYLSFWNDNISYALRGCILIELALRRRIALVRDSNRRRQPLPDRLIEVIDERQTGETILDETLKMIRGQELVGERLGVGSWIDLLSGETWNVLRISFQLKQVRERLAKGLVDKGVLRTEKRNFLLFDMATHPLADPSAKKDVIRRVVGLLTSTTSAVPPEALGKEGEQCRVMRSISLVCAAYAASVLDGAFGGAPSVGGRDSGTGRGAMGYEEREACFARADEILAAFGGWPFGSNIDSSSTPGRRKSQTRIATGSSSNTSQESILGLIAEAKKEMIVPEGASEGEDVGFELVAAVLEVLGKLDSLL